MTSLVDSEAHLTSRLRELGLVPAVIDAINRHGVTTMSGLAFAIGQPGQPIQDAAVDNFVTAAIGRAANLRETTAVKRAVFEAHTFLIATLRQSVEKPDDVPRKIAFAERQTRMEQLRQNLAGVDISGELEPAHKLLDKTCTIYEANSLTYLELATCISRTQEISGVAKNKEISVERNGSITLKTTDDGMQCQTDSEIKVHYAMVRRAIAFQFARLMSHAQHCQWESFLFEAMHREVPPGYHRPSLVQLLQCDKAAFARLGATVHDVKQRGDGTYPLGEALLALKNDPAITLYLAPLSRPQSSGSYGGMTGGNQPKAGQPYNASNSSNKGRGKGKRKRNSRSSPPMPAELRGKFHKMANGDPICFGYNSASGCPDKSVKPGGRCQRGFHVCMEPKCQQAHSLREHGKS